jgi:hypothetical protein
LKRVVKLLKLFSDNSFSAPSTLQQNLAWLIAVYCLLVTFSAQAYEESPERYALVIGNTSYPYSPLINPINDARAIDKKLESQEFAVTLVLDAGSDELSSAISAFYQGIEEEKSLKRIVSMVYYAGHAMQHQTSKLLSPDRFQLC